MYSFAIHDMGEDTLHTNWDNPQTAHDKIRVAFKDNGRPYYIRDTVRYHMVHDIVKPLVEGPGNEVIEWWKSGGGSEAEVEAIGEQQGQEIDNTIGSMVLQ